MRDKKTCKCLSNNIFLLGRAESMVLLAPSGAIWCGGSHSDLLFRTPRYRAATGYLFHNIFVMFSRLKQAIIPLLNLILN